MLHFTQTTAFLSITIACVVAIVLNAVARLTGTTGDPRAPAFYVIVAAVISLAAVLLTLRESAGRPLPAVATIEVAAP